MEKTGNCAELGMCLLYESSLSLFKQQGERAHPSPRETHFHHVSNANEQHSQSGGCCFANSCRGAGRDAHPS